MNKHTLTGIILTAVWLIIIFLVIYNKGFNQLSALELNEIGDFLAGAAAPLALLWFVIGYLLQTKELELQRNELEQNTAMLELQKDELEKQSEELQRQADILQEQLEIAQEDRERAMLPNLLFRKVDITNGGRRAVIVIKNTGSKIQDLQIILNNYAKAESAQLIEETNYEHSNEQIWRLLFSGDYTIKPELVEIIFTLSFQVINETYWHVPCVMKNMKIEIGKYAQGQKKPD